jgi:hypothetical protein
MTHQGVKIVKRSYRIVPQLADTDKHDFKTTLFPLAEKTVCGYYQCNAHRRRSFEAATHLLMCDSSKSPLVYFYAP